MTSLVFHYAPPAGRQGSVTVDLAGYSDTDMIVREIRRNNTFYESDLLEHIQLAGPQGGIYLDVGANIGNHAVYFAAFCADHVVSFEPHPSLLPILRRNLECNCPGQHTVMPTAVSDRAGAGRMTLRHGFEDNIAGSQVQAVETPEAPGQTPDVPITTLDDALDRIVPACGSKISLMKVDVEGMELAVFRGATRLLAEHRPQIIVELATEEARSAARSYLAQFGYRDCGLRFGWTPTYHLIDPTVHQLRPYAVPPRRDDMVVLLEEVTQELLAVVPEGQSYLFVDEEQWWAGLAADGRQRIPFTERDGLYWGPPLNDEAALDELQRLRARGPGFMIFAAPAFWWLDYYKGLAEHLRTHHRLVWQNERLIAFELR